MKLYHNKNISVLSSRFWLICGSFLFSSHVFGQSFGRGITDDNVRSIINEALQGHDEFVRGVIGDALNKFKDDSLLGKWNEDQMSQILASEEFRHHSTRVDTQYTADVEGNDMVFHYISFRDIHYLGNNRFRRFKIHFAYLCTRGKDFTIVERRLTVGTKEIANQYTWGRWRWD